MSSTAQATNSAARQDVSVCIATYKRSERLALLLDDLAAQTHLPAEVTVVDNDEQASARETVESRRAQLPFALRYEVQPLKNISVTRNRSVALASGAWLAFIDDDERAPAAWLAQLLEAAQRHGADAVLGPVEPLVPTDAPAWIRHGRFYDWARMATGSIVPRNQLRFGNVLIEAAWLRERAFAFDPAYGLTGGEDGDLLSRLAQHGARIVWCDEAVVHEPIERSRLSLRWLLRRALRGGQDFARHTVAGRYGDIGLAGRLRFVGRALAQALAAGGLALLLWPLGRHHAAFWLTKLSANLGKLSVFWGAHYREYA